LNLTINFWILPFKKTDSDVLDFFSSRQCVGDLYSREANADNTEMLMLRGSNDELFLPFYEEQMQKLATAATTMEVFGGPGQMEVRRKIKRRNCEKTYLGKQPQNSSHEKVTLYFSSIVDDIYRNGYNSHTSGEDNSRGGGPLPVSKNGCKNVILKFLSWFEYRTNIDECLIIIWIGQGFAVCTKIRLFICICVIPRSYRRVAYLYCRRKFACLHCVLDIWGKN